MLSPCSITPFSHTMASYLSQRKSAVTAKLASHTKLSGWVLEKQPTSFAEEGEWTNIDSDVTPEERRTWSSMTIAGFWFSDALNAQGWEAPSSIISAGLTWKEAFYLSMFPPRFLPSSRRKDHRASARRVLRRRAHSDQDLRFDRGCYLP